MTADSFVKLFLCLFLVIGVVGLLLFHILTRPRDLYSYEPFLMRDVLTGHLRIPMEWKTDYEPDGGAVFLWPRPTAVLNLDQIQETLNRRVELGRDRHGKTVLIVHRERYRKEDSTP